MALDLTQFSPDSPELVFTNRDQNGEQATDRAVPVFDDLNVPLYLNRTLLDAARKNASDLHLEPDHSSYRIRFRIDGVMQEIATLPRGFGLLLTSRIKVIAGMDISEQRITQKGRFRLQLGQQAALDFRASTIPTLHGETLVLRLLYLPEGLLDLNLLGLEPEQIELILQSLRRQQGMIIVAGPTGCGKTVTLYTLMRHLNQQKRNLYSVEDPVEIDLPGINQVQVDDRVSFHEATRTLLRQDPDVIMLGEMRDQETLDTAIRAAHTGHLLMTTLHANTAPKAVSRLCHLGARAYDVATTVSLIICQRLLRRVDPATRIKAEYPEERLLALGLKKEELHNLQLYRADSYLPGDGYKGRVGIFQLMPITESLAASITNGISDLEMSRLLNQQNFLSLRQSALNKLRAGLTDVAEIERVLGPVEQDYFQTDLQAINPSALLENKA